MPTKGRHNQPDKGKLKEEIVERLANGPKKGESTDSWLAAANRLTKSAEGQISDKAAKAAWMEAIARGVVSENLANSDLDFLAHVPKAMQAAKEEMGRLEMIKDAAALHSILDARQIRIAVAAGKEMIGIQKAVLDRILWIRGSPADFKALSETIDRGICDLLEEV